jgi:hypothetical protein
MQCSNNLKQIALATINFHETFGAFPPARTQERPLGVDPPSLRGGNEHATWLVRIEPFLEQDNAYRLWDLTQSYAAQSDAARSTIVSTYVCPTRRSATPSQVVTPTTQGPPIVLPCGCSFPGGLVPGGASTDYAGNHGDLSPGSSGKPTDFYWGGNGTGVIQSSRGVSDGTSLVDWYDKIRMRDIRDGASNTFLAGEMHVPRDKVAQVPDNGPAYDGSRFYNMSRVGGPTVPIASGPDDTVFGLGLYAFGSWHPGICQFAFVDGRVNAVRTTISTTTLERLCNRADGQSVELE